ncbi:GATA zinc finger domain-containing protein 14-like [Caenorhabditis elegans]|uniref:GATA zinc finger domain-containing protein 14-like n=1 Tax=Caenorhabditis elegans TaxID=6239 RepID=Q9XVC1_CAEEL|nr:GATA zinc finger domain-containing protein 14-like [Caenorhabditis elegans]CAB03959.1 GATA zinc finger domain-containing protein 14-like [Caenorhabditis elegans]|eukprot:NP_507765.1 Uncharacterized protein CELE_C43D7.4 [Caenorhabditis elegans]
MVYVHANVDTNIDNRKDNCDNRNTNSHSVDRKDNFGNTNTNLHSVNRKDNCDNREDGDMNLYYREDNCNNREETQFRTLHYSCHNQQIINSFTGNNIDNRVINLSGANFPKKMDGAELMRVFFNAPMSMPTSSKNAIMDRQEGSTQPAIRYNNR